MYSHREARSLRRLTGEVVRWLHPEEPARLAQTMAGWNAATWQAVRQVVHVQGLAAHLHRTLPGGALAQHLPEEFRTWLAHEYAMNTARVRVLHEELAAILCAARHADICVMPLKGALLSTHYYADPGLRPLGDLDLLIHPAALPEMIAILTRLGYRVPEKIPIGARRYANHFLFLNAKTPAIVSYTGEHPDNPRTVELHTALQRGLWGKFGAYDITALMWKNASKGHLWGEPVPLPTAAALLCHTAIHAARHFLGGDGRAIQWLDLALLSPYLAEMDRTYRNWLYPILRLASRALPGRLEEGQLATLGQPLHRRLRHWAETVPLDTRCGLVMRFSDHEQFLRSWWGRGQQHINYWYPSPLRMAWFASELSPAQAYRQFVSAYSLHWRTWVSDLYQQHRAARQQETRKPLI
jgi:hypothetical protein